MCFRLFSFFFFFNDTATTEIYPLSLHDALPIYCGGFDLTQAVLLDRKDLLQQILAGLPAGSPIRFSNRRSEEHTSELQSLRHLVCRLLLEKKKKQLMLAVVHRAMTSHRVYECKL